MASLLSTDQINERPGKQSEPKVNDKTELPEDPLTSVTQASNEITDALDSEWKAGGEEWMIIIVIAIVSLMVALDPTILVPALPVSALSSDIPKPVDLAA